LGRSRQAVVELKPGMQATEAELEQLCRARLAGYKIPKSFEFWREIPRSPVGKVLKREIRARYWQAAGNRFERSITSRSLNLSASRSWSHYHARFGMFPIRRP